MARARFRLYGPRIVAVTASSTAPIRDWVSSIDGVPADHARNGYS